MHRYVFRIIRNDEEYWNGLFAKNPFSTTSVASHVVRTQDETPWISTSCSLASLAAYGKTSAYTIVMIDLDKIDRFPEDARHRGDFYNNALRYGIRAQELTFYQTIPKEAVTLFAEVPSLELAEGERPRVMTPFDESVLKEAIAVLPPQEQRRMASLPEKVLHFFNAANEHNELDLEAWRNGKDNKDQLYLQWYQQETARLFRLMEQSCHIFLQQGNQRKAADTYIACTKIQYHMQERMLTNHCKELTKKEQETITDLYSYVEEVPCQYQYRPMLDEVVEDPSAIIDMPHAAPSVQLEAVRQDFSVLELLKDGSYPVKPTVFVEEYEKDYLASREVCEHIQQDKESGLWTVRLPHCNTAPVIDQLRGQNENILVISQVYPNEKKDQNHKERVHAEFIGKPEILPQLEKKFSGIIVGDRWQGNANVKKLAELCKKEIKDLTLLYLLSKTNSLSLEDVKKEFQLRQHFYPEVHGNNEKLVISDMQR